MKWKSTHGVTAAMSMAVKLAIPSKKSASFASYCFPVSGFHWDTNSWPALCSCVNIDPLSKAEEVTERVPKVRISALQLVLN